MAQAIETHEMPESVEEGERRANSELQIKATSRTHFLPICFSIHCSTNAYGYHYY